MVGPLDCAEHLWLTLEFPSYMTSLDELIAGERASGMLWASGLSSGGPSGRCEYLEGLIVEGVLAKSCSCQRQAGGNA